MKLRAITMNTFAGLVRNKIIILFCVGCTCILLLMLSSLLLIRNMRNVQNAEQMQAAVLPLIGSMMALVSGFGSLLAAWSAADALSSEMRSGTILAVMARPVRRWEFLLGKYLGVQLLMLVFVMIMVGLNYLLAWIGGAHGVRILVDAARKRETVESLWAAGCDVTAMNPLRSTLEELFLKEVDHR